jgi:hypothetical protein
MNTFYEHHKHSIKFAYRCFDRILLNGLIQPFQQPERVIGFFDAYRESRRVTRLWGLPCGFTSSSTQQMDCTTSRFVRSLRPPTL